VMVKNDNSTHARFNSDVVALLVVKGIVIGTELI
jgi:hypothetical protein